MSNRSVFFVSDHTGLTAEALGQSLLVQFDQVRFNRHTVPFVDSHEKAQAVSRLINQAALDDSVRPLVFSTLTNQLHREVIRSANCLYLDFFDTFIAPLEIELKTKPSGATGRLHSVDVNYTGRIDAINFALSHDDGLGSHLEQADIILVGVSRSGKTPTSLYMALHYSLLAANYPLTEEDFEKRGLPGVLQAYREKLFGLTIRPDRLAQIREVRRPASRYADLSNCRREVLQAETLFRSQAIPFIDSTAKSVEEIASAIVHEAGLGDRLADTMF